MTHGLEEWLKCKHEVIAGANRKRKPSIGSKERKYLASFFALRVVDSISEEDWKEEQQNLRELTCMRHRPYRTISANDRKIMKSAALLLKNERRHLILDKEP